MQTTDIELAMFHCKEMQKTQRDYWHALQHIMLVQFWYAIKNREAEKIIAKYPKLFEGY